MAPNRVLRQRPQSLGSHSLQTQTFDLRRRRMDHTLKRTGLRKPCAGDVSPVLAVVNARHLSESVFPVPALVPASTAR